MSELLKLAERCEAATGPDRELDTEILWHVDRRRFASGYWNAASGLPRELEVMPTPGGGLGWVGAQCSAPDYTASLDAALTLVPEGWRLAALEQREGWWAMFCRFGEGLVSGQGGRREAATPALALCAAALRAHAATQPEKPA